MKRCRVCNKIVDYSGVGLDLVICTPCVCKGALAEDTPTDAIRKIAAEDKKRLKKVKLNFEYEWLENEWGLKISAMISEGYDFFITLPERELKYHLEEIKKLEKPGNEEPPDK